MKPLVVLMLLLLAYPTHAQEPATVEATAWQKYKTRFLDPGGRIIDDANGDISHSEGQGYGLLLAFLAGSRADFELIWSFTRRELLLRDDGLAAWKWSPGEAPHVSDTNNATDGDILIAYALARAGVSWDRKDYTRAATALAEAILEKTVVEHGGLTLLLPGAQGFSAADRADGPVINPSYWVFEAFPVLEQLVPSPAWKALAADGEAILKRLEFGPKKLPADWISARTVFKPAEGFPSEYGYNALRIPLYLVRSGRTDSELLSRIYRGMSDAKGAVLLSDVESGAVEETLTDPGYRIINHILACVLQGTKLPDDMKTFEPTQYYPSTMHLLGLSFVEEMRPECL